MEKNFNLDIISPESILISEKVNSVTIPSFEGEMTILVDHIPLITFLRPGIISSKEIKKILKTKLSKTKSHIKSPGMLKKHYSPGIPVEIVKKPKNSKHAYIVFGKKYNNSRNFFNLSKKGDLNEAAANLYKTMRKIKKKGFKKIFVLKFPNFGPGIAINDRLLRASK